MKKVRIQMDFSGSAIEKLDQIKTTIGVSSRGEVVRVALDLLAYVVYVAETGKPFATEVAGKKYALTIKRISK